LWCFGKFREVTTTVENCTASRVLDRPLRSHLKNWLEKSGEDNMTSRTLTCVFGAGIAVVVLQATPAWAYWQFIERPAGVEVKPSARYSSQKTCEAALKKAEAALKKRYPDRYPLVGSCEQFQ
jgi:hypothetical protein